MPSPALATAATAAIGPTGPTGAAAKTSPPSLTLSWRSAAPGPFPRRGVAGVYIVWRKSRYGLDCLAVGEARDIAADLART